MPKKYVSVFWGTVENGGIFTNSTTPFSIAGAAHAVRLRHCRANLVLGEVVFGGQNQATKPERVKAATGWIDRQDPLPGDIIQVIDVNQGIRYAVIVCVGEKRGRYDN
jgi:hypothetical protein